MCVDPDWNTERSRQAEISELDDTVVSYQQVLWLQIAMQHPMRMAVNDAKADLIEKTLESEHK